MKSLLALSMMTVVIPLSSCPQLNRQTTVRLINNTDFEVQVQLFYDDDQELPEDLIQADGTEVNRTLAAGEAQSFSRDCEALQAIFIENAALNIIGDIGPEAGTDVYREPDDFGCGDTLTFTFTSNALGTDLDVSFSATQ
jgi:hypothetical protein